MIAATPGPWRVKPTDRRKVEGTPFEEGTVVASCWTSSFAPPSDEAAANAALIVRAVNSFEALVTALRGWLTIFGAEGAYVSPLVGTALIETRAALAKATGEVTE